MNELKKKVYMLVVAALVALAFFPTGAFTEDIKIDPNLLKHLLEKKVIMKPGKLESYLFKFNVPVNIKKVHKDVEKAYVVCIVKDTSTDFSNYGYGISEIPMNNGEYNGDVAVFITDMEDGDPAGTSEWQCLLAFKVNVPDSTGIVPVGLFITDPVYGAAPNTLNTVEVKGTLFP